MNAALAFAPPLGWWLPGILALIAGVLLGYSAWRRARGTGWRALAVAALLLGLINPALIEEEREPLDDIAVVLLDESLSQTLGERAGRTEAAGAALVEALERQAGLELRVVRVPGATPEEEAAGRGGTRMLEALEQALSDVPPQRVAGAVLVTDGQVHDAGEVEWSDAPLHVLLTGERNEGDRRLVIEQAPRFGIVGQDVELVVRIEDTGAATGDVGRVTIRVDDGPPRSISLPIGVAERIPVRLNHGGTNFVELEVAPGRQELTLANNRAALGISGVRDRLRVLLVSGVPHAGERTWRNLLKSDPAVDLVHFTILRPPEKQDRTPVRELSLIAFPIRELFEVKLAEFDLIIFDHYQLRGVLPNLYLQNIVDYVRAGGAFLEASGPAFAGPLSVALTPLGAILPGEPTGRVLERGFRPRVTELGQRHPVTAGLGSGDPAAPEWGRWFRQLEVTPHGGVVAMEGIDGWPLLMLDRIGEGRVAQLASDHIWLWARGFEGGGPQAELLRRTAHWLMQEPELEEEVLRGIAQGGTLSILRRSLDPTAQPVTVAGPDGDARTVVLAEEAPGVFTGTVPVDTPGLYRLSDGRLSALAAVGALNPLELSDVRTTEALLRPAVAESGGRLIWLAEDGMPGIRRVSPGRETAGPGWLGLVARGDYLVSGVTTRSLVPALLGLLLALGALMAAWRREGR